METEVMTYIIIYMKQNTIKHYNMVAGQREEIVVQLLSGDFTLAEKCSLYM